MDGNDLKLFSGTANPELSKKVASYLKMNLGDIHIRRFSDGEVFCRINENVRNSDVFLIQPTCAPANENIMELLVIMDALKRASAGRINVVMPYYGYARQDRKDSPRTPISARLVADLIQSVGANRIFCLDLHAPQIQGFYNIPVDHLFAAPVLLNRLLKLVPNDRSKVVLVSPDAGGVERTRAYAKRLDCSIAIADKRRDAPGHVAEVNIIGDVKGKEAILIDDIIDTAGTMVEVSKVLLKSGAEKVWACCTHPVLSGPATKRIMESPLERVLVTDTIPTADKEAICPKIEVLTVSELLGEAIARIHRGDSVSSLFI